MTLFEHTNQKGTIEEIAANGILTLIYVTNSLLDKQLTAQADAFVQEGGFTERLYHTRKAQQK